MQEQVQEHKIASFEEICPDLSNLIAEKGGYMKVRQNTYTSKDGQVTRDIMQCANCIVGEAHSVKL